MIITMTAVYLEVGKQKVFAGALDWPGWGRFARTEEAAVEALAAYTPRYRVVTQRAKVPFPARAGDQLKVVERLPGSASTDFGVPHEAAAADAKPVTAAAAKRTAALLRASWAIFDEIVAGAPAELRKGPRGGGRDRDKIVAHVIESEPVYLRKLGVKLPVPAIDDEAGIAELRDAVVDVLSRRSDGTPPVEKGWLPRYAARRIAWHVLDHAWEIEDRS
jgi:hypothetical protein